MLLLIMIRVQYFANFAGGIAVTVSDICTGPPNFFRLLGSNGIQTTFLKFKFHYVYFMVIGHLKASLFYM